MAECADFQYPVRRLISDHIGHAKVVDKLVKFLECNTWWTRTAETQHMIIFWW